MHGNPLGLCLSTVPKEEHGDVLRLAGFEGVEMNGTGGGGGRGDAKKGGEEKEDEERSLLPGQTPMPTHFFKVGAKLPGRKREEPSGLEEKLFFTKLQVENDRFRRWEDLLSSPDGHDDGGGGGDNHCSIRSTHFGLHGSPTENFHSILSHGLQQHMNKVIC